MKYKKVVPILGIISVVAPLATLVACDNTSTLHPEWTDETMKDHLDYLQSYNFNADATWPLNETDILESVTNTKENGLLSLLRLNGFTNASMSELLDNSVIAKNGKPQSYAYTLSVADMAHGIETSNPFWTKTISKDEILKNDKVLLTINEEIIKLINDNPSLNLGIKTTKTKPDVKTTDSNNGITFNGGEYRIDVYALKQVETNAKTSDLKNMMLDKNLFAPDLEQLKRMGGSYILGQAYGKNTGIFDTENTQSPQSITIFGTTTTIKAGGPKYDDFKDRSVEWHMKSWFGFGPIAEIAKSISDPLNDLKVIAYPIQDNKTGNYKLLVTTWDQDPTILDTNVSLQVAPGTVVPFPGGFKSGKNILSFEIPFNEIISFNHGVPYVRIKLQYLLTNSTNFKRVYNFVKDLPKELLDTYANSAKSPVIDLYKNIILMYQSKDLINDDSFMSAFESYLSNTPFDVNTFTTVLDNVRQQELYSPDVWGAKRLEMVAQVAMFYNSMREFLKQNPNFENQLLPKSGFADAIGGKT